MSAYLVEAHDGWYHNKKIQIENLTPAYQTWEEREDIRKEIKEQLYDVFRKYMGNDS